MRKVQSLTLIQTVSEMQVTSLCWRPDGKALAVGHDDGSIAIHDVEVRLFVIYMQLKKTFVSC